MKAKTSMHIVFSHSQYRASHQKTPSGRGNWAFSIRPGALPDAALDAAALHDLSQSAEGKRIIIDRKVYQGREVVLWVRPVMTRIEAQRKIARMLRDAAYRAKLSDPSARVPSVLPVEVCP